MDGHDLRGNLCWMEAEKQRKKKACKRDGGVYNYQVFSEGSEGGMYTGRYGWVGMGNG